MASQALQVSIETRFLIVQRNYLEDIGVDADFTLNPLRNPADPTSGIWSSHFSPIPVIQNQVTDNSTFRDANGNVVSNPAQGSRTLDWQSNVGNASYSLPMKRCGLCCKTKALTEFHRRSSGHQSWCKSCRQAYDSAYHRG